MLRCLLPGLALVPGSPPPDAPPLSRPPPAVRVVLRCLLPGRPSPSCLFLDVNHDNTSALKVC